MKFDKSLAMRTRIYWIVFFVFATLFISAEMISMIVNQESQGMAAGVTRYLLIITFIIGLILFLISYMGASIFGGAIAFFLTFALFSLKLNYFEVILVRHAYIYVALFVIVFIILAYSLIPKIKRDELPSLRLYVVLGVILFAPVLINNYFDNNSESLDEDKDYFSEYRKITLRDKPNIYLLSYDSLIPPEVADKYLNIQKVPYEKATNDFLRIYPDSITFRVPSLPSLNSIMRLDQRSQSYSLQLFAGRKPSILEQIMHANGYKVVSGYNSYYFGEKGQYVDQYLMDLKIDKSTLCIEPGSSIRMKMRGFFLCGVYEYIKNNHQAIYSIVFGKLSDNKHSSWHDTVFQHIERVSSHETPTLSFIYTFRPLGHAPLDYDNENEKDKSEYKKYFLTEARHFNELLLKIREKILQHDPESIVVFFGDHGPLLGREADKRDRPEFYYSNRHRILLGILKTENICSKPEPRFVTESYATPSRVILDIIDCLSLNGVPGDIISFDDDKSILKYIFHQESNGSEPINPR